MSAIPGTSVRSVPLVPRISLHLAGEPVEFWESVEASTGRTGTDPPFWAFAWAGGQALARYLLDHPAAVASRRVIDLASGSGLVAIAAALAGAAEVTAYDIDPLAVTAIAANASVNDVSVAAECRDILDDDGSAGADLVLVADAFYERRFAARMTGFLRRAHAHGTAVLIGDLGRTYLPRDLLVPLAAYDVGGLRSLEDDDMKRTSIWSFPHLPAGRFVLC
jgi:predicted nicotinamide N-methyase